MCGSDSSASQRNLAWNSNETPLQFTQLVQHLPMRTTFADLLVWVGATKDFGHNLILSQSFQCLINTLYQTHKELHGVLLLPKIYRLTLQPSQKQKLAIKNRTGFMNSNKGLQRQHHFYQSFSYLIHYYENMWELPTTEKNRNNEITWTDARGRGEHSTGADWMPNDRK